MKKFWGFLLGCTLSLGFITSASALTTHKPSDWVANGDQGNVEKVDDNTVKLSGPSNYGPYSKASTAKLKDGITEQTYVDLNFDDIKDGGFFEVTLGLKDAKNNYVTEAVVMSQRVGDKIRLTAGWAKDFNLEVTEEGIYTYEWKMYTKADNVTYVVFTLLKDGKTIGSTGEVSLDSDEAKGPDSKSPVANQEDVSVKYLWFCNIQTDGNGKGTVKVYSKLPGTENAEIVEPAADSNLAVADAEKVSDILKKSLEGLDLEGLTDDTAVEFDVESEEVELEEAEVSKFTAVLSESTKNAKIANYFDISIAVKDSMTNTKLGNIEKLTEGIELIVNLPTDLPEVAEGYQRQYYILRQHGDEITVLPTTLSEDGLALSFISDEFSTYALAYEDVSTASSAVPTENPETFDNVTAYLAIGAVALTGLTGLAYAVKRKLED